MSATLGVPLFRFLLLPPDEDEDEDSGHPSVSGQAVDSSSGSAVAVAAGSPAAAASGICKAVFAV